MKEMRSRLSVPGLKVGISVEACEEGVPRSLERVARDRGSDLIVLSAHGHGATRSGPSAAHRNDSSSPGISRCWCSRTSRGAAEPGEGAPEASQHFGTLDGTAGRAVSAGDGGIGLPPRERSPRGIASLSGGC
jgi:hypothetical protein